MLHENGFEVGKLDGQKTAHGGRVVFIDHEDTHQLDQIWSRVKESRQSSDVVLCASFGIGPAVESWSCQLIRSPADLK